MKALLRITCVIVVLIGFCSFASSIICHTSKCDVKIDPKFDCRSTYLTTYVRCGSSDTVCTKTMLFNTTASTPSVESSQWMSVTRSPLVSVIRACGTNTLNLPMNCYQARKIGHNYDAHFCLCDSDYCNEGSSTLGSGSLVLIAVALATSYSQARLLKDILSSLH